MKRHFLKLISFIMLSVLCCTVLVAESAVQAEEEFRRGIQAYNRGSFNDAILQFEKALTYLPEEKLIIDWLGRSYYRAGMEEAAIQEWSYALNQGYGGAMLENTLEILQARRIFSSSRFDEYYSEAAVLDGNDGTTLFFNRPVSVLAEKDGSFWAVAYGSNEILRINVNGYVTSRKKGPLNGYDRPMDIMKTSSGKLVITEFAGDRLSFLDENGDYLSSFGSKGRGDGQLLGPQYLAEDSSGNIYVTDFGNARVAVFSSEGEFLFNFGSFISPTGIAAAGERIFVADSITGAVYEYDNAGNYKGLFIAEDTLVQPEALRVRGNALYICDGNRLLSASLETGALFEMANTGNAPSRLTCADEDANGNIIAADFTSDEIYIYSQMSELVGGLYAEITRINADNFPKVQLEVRIENRRRQPVVGLQSNNFLITEDKRTVSGQLMTGAASNDDYGDITIIIDRSADMAGRDSDVQTAVREIAAAMNGKGKLRVVSAGQIPATELVVNPADVKNFQPSKLETPLADSVSLDLAVRLAANDLINASYKRGIIYIGRGESERQTYENYTLSNLSAYLGNNGIYFGFINIDNTATAGEITYLTEYTGGDSYYLYRPQGISSIVEEFIDKPNGYYTFEYTSSLYTNYGKKFLPVEFEVYLMNRSGRAESGYYAPLE